MSTNRVEILRDAAISTNMHSWVAGFLLPGVLIGELGSLLIVWQYHITEHPQIVGLHFLALNAGYVAAAAIAQRTLARVSIRSVAVLACALASATLVALSFLAPPMPPIWRLAVLVFVGVAAGALVTTLLHALEPYYESQRASAANICGEMFSTGCLLATLTVGATYFAGSVQLETALLAIVPLVFLCIYAIDWRPTPVTRPRHDVDLRESLRDLRSVAAVLFSLILFFQFGNEWAIAGWLPLFLVHRLGTRPEWAIAALALYFLALTIGRAGAQRLLPSVKHRRLLLAGIALAMLGYLGLSFATSLAAALLAIVIIGAGFAPIYPLIAENLDERFSYHPGFYNGIFSIAITGGMSAPWLLGYIDSWLGMPYVMFVPALGSVAVFILILLLMFEAQLMGAGRNDLRAN